MLNQVILVGLLKKVTKLDDYFSNIEIEVVRSFKELKGGFKSDFLTIIVWKGIADSLLQDNIINRNISICGRLESDDKQIKIIAEKVDYVGRSLNFKGG